MPYYRINHKCRFMDSNGYLPPAAVPSSDPEIILAEGGVFKGTPSANGMVIETDEECHPYKKSKIKISNEHLTQLEMKDASEEGKAAVREHPIVYLGGYHGGGKRRKSRRRKSKRRSKSKRRRKSRRRKSKRK